MLERIIEKYLYASRWFLAPIYLGLTIVVLLLVVKFALKLAAIIGQITVIDPDDLVLAALSLVDMVLLGNLVLMVILSGYENFVSHLDSATEDKRLSWLGKIDSGALKLKLAVSIVAISSIHLLSSFMEAEKYDKDTLMWEVIVHMAFVLSALCLAFIDKMGVKH